jgi:hypothetical protein
MISSKPVLYKTLPSPLAKRFCRMEKYSSSTWSMIGNILRTITFTSLGLFSVSFAEAFAAYSPFSIQVPKSLIFVYALSGFSIVVFKDSRSFMVPGLQQTIRGDQPSLLRSPMTYRRLNIETLSSHEPRDRIDCWFISYFAT